MDVLIQAQERVISVERIIDRPIETPITVPKESIVEKVSTIRFENHLLDSS